LPGASSWSTTLQDPLVGSVRLTGELREQPGSRELFVLIHGLGGSTASYYVRSMAAWLAAAGKSTLALALRGADRGGEDFYNVALTADLHASVASPALAHHERIFLVGFSMGGYVALHYAAEVDDPRVRAVAAVSTPFDLHSAQVHIDSLAALPYRNHVLRGLKSIYAAVARRRAVPTDPALVSKVRSIHAWDRLTIAPRYGFASPEDYYERLSVVPRLAALRRPALLVCAERDPIVPPSTIRPFLPRERSGAERLEVFWSRRAGHVSFPGDLDLGCKGEKGLAAQVTAWLLER
jgi:predicted alpha/beta-fold hydrolase